MIPRIVIDLWLRPLGQGIVGTLTAIGLGIASAASVASSAIGSHAASSAADAQAQAANNAATLQHQDSQAALDFQKEQYNNSLKMLSPWLGTGTSAINRLGYLMGLPPNAQSQSPNMAGNTNQVPQTQIGFGGGGTGDINPAVGGGGGLIRAQAFNGQVPFRDVNGASLDPNNMPEGFTPNGVQGNAQSSGTQPGSIQQPGTTDLPGQNFGPAQFAGNPGDPSAAPGQVPFQNPDTNPGAWPGLNGTPGSPTPMNGSPGMVPRIDGGGAPGAASNDPANQFGYLAKTWDENFQAPTDVTEQNDPGYQFRLKQGMQALQNSAASKGNLLTGGTAKGLNDYAQNSASAEYGNVYNRSFNDYTTRYNQFKQNQNDLFNRFATLSGVGQTSAGQLSNAGLQSANNAGNILMTSGQQIGNDLQNAGAARGSGYVGSANAITGGLSGISNMAQLLSMMKNQGGGTNPNAGWGVN